MLTPSYLLHATEPAEEIAEKLHQDILRRIIERIRIRFERGDDYVLTAIDKWQIETLQQAGFLLDEIQKEIASATDLMITEIAEAMEDAGVTALEYDDKIYREAGLDPAPLTQSPHLIQVMQRDYEATFGEWENFTRTTAASSQQTFIRLCDTAYHQAITGMISPQQAVKEALEELIRDGIYVTYPSGHRETIESATARCVRTGISQASAHIQTARMDEFGVDLVIVSSHLGARPSHQVWQGKVYSRTGSGKYPDFVSSTDYGSVSGLCGANCRHHFSPWFEGQGNPFEQFDAEENLKQYELEQRQRTLERRIRHTKQQVLGYDAAGDKENYERKSALLQKQNEAYNKFCEENGLKKQQDRISIARWNRSEAAKARAAVKKHQKEVANSENRGKMKERGLSMSLRRPKSYILNDSEIKSVIDDAKSIDINPDVLRFNKGSQTGFLESRGCINIRGDILPDLDGLTARDRMTQRAVLAHEYYGHYKNHPSPYEINDWRDEFKASYDAAINTPNLTDEERRDLMIDAYDRAKEAGAFEGYDEVARRIIYGF